MQSVTRPIPGNALYFCMDVDFVRGSEKGVSRVLDFCAQQRLKCSFFITGLFAQEYPEYVAEMARQGHDLGTHGWDHGHGSKENFRLDPYAEQKWRLAKSTEAVHKASGVRPVMFRAPNLWVNEVTLRVLEEEGYRLDSSVPAKRLVGRIRSLKYFLAPNRPYHPARANISRVGDSPILEAPPASFFMPINLSSLRMLGLGLIKPLVRLHRLTTSAHVFYGHPAEYQPLEELQFPVLPPKRHVEGIGPHNLELTARFLEFMRRLGYRAELMSSLLG